MKRTLLRLALTSLVFTSLCAFAATTPTPTATTTSAQDAKGIQLKDKKDKISYSIGVDIGKSVKKQKLDLNVAAFSAGFSDGQTDKPTKMTEEEIRQTLLALQTEMTERHKNEMKVLAEKNKVESEAFLANNKKQKGIVTLPDGLQYRIITQGTGESPKATDTVSTHYRGKLVNGTEFDSSYARGEPAKFVVNGVIPGWTEALQLMKPGAKWELFVPANLAYGEHGVGQVIGPNAALIFEVELLNVEKTQPKTTAAPTSTTR